MPKKSRSKSKLGILAFDIAFHRTGWAQFYNGKLMRVGALELPEQFAKVKSNDLEFGKALNWLCTNIHTLCNVSKGLNPIHLVAVEDYNCRFVLAAKTILQAQAAVKIGIARGLGKPIVLVHNKQAKSLLGVPNAKRLYPKEAVETAKRLKIKPVKVICVDAVNRMYGTDLSYSQDDEADAIALAQSLHNQVTSHWRNRAR